MSKQRYIVERLREWEYTRNAHTPANQGHGYDRCEHCGHTRHPCEVYSMACDALEAADEIEQAHLELAKLPTEPFKSFGFLVLSLGERIAHVRDIWENDIRDKASAEKDQAK